MKYPKEVPILNGNDLKCGCSRPGSTRHCLVEWANLTFASKKDLRMMERGRGKTLDWQLPSVKPVYELLEWEFQRAGILRGLSRYPARDNVMSANDYSKPSFNAKIWNRAMARLGYTEGNPEKITPR